MLRDLIKRALLRRDIILSRPPGQFDLFALKLAKARDRGLKIDVAVDGGAATGRWTEDFKEVFPAARVLCVEPRSDVQAELKRRTAQFDGVVIAQTLLGASEGEATFFQYRDQSSVLPDHQGNDWAHKTTAPMTTLDALMTRLGMPHPDVIKLDLQGCELEALKGATRCLEHAQAVLMEVSFIELQKGTPTVADVVAFMNEREFAVYDITALSHRPLDGALAQGDFLFVTRKNVVWADKRWER